MNVEIGTEAAQFPEKEYINGIFLALDTASDLVDVVAVGRTADGRGGWAWSGGGRGGRRGCCRPRDVVAAVGGGGGGGGGSKGGEEDGWGPV